MTDQQQAVAAKSNPMAIAVFVIGVIALLAAFAKLDQFLPIVGGLIAVALGTMAYRHSTETGKGRTFAVIGAVAGGVAILLSFTLAR